MPRLFPSYATLVAAVVAACAFEAPDTNTFSSRETLADGTVLVRYPSLPIDDVARAQANLTIGTVDGDLATVFGDVRGIEAGRDGTIYVLDYQASEVRAFDREGRFLHTVASKGEGPGELTEANGMILIGDTLLWIQDHAKWMMIGVDREGEEVARVPMHVRSYGYIWSGTVDQAGLFWKEQTHSDEERGYPPEEGLQQNSFRRYMISYDAATDRTDSIYLGDGSRRTLIARTAGGYSYWGVPNDPQPLSIVDPAGGFWQADGTEYRLARLNESGDTVLVIESDTPPISVTSRDRSLFVQRVVDRSPDDRRVAEEVADMMPKTKPLIDGLVVDDEGRLWVRRAVPDDALPQFDIFTRDGQYQGTVQLEFQPAPYVPIRIRGGQIYALVPDSLDIPFVIRASVHQ